MKNEGAAKFIANVRSSVLLGDRWLKVTRVFCACWTICFSITETITINMPVCENEI